MSHHKRVGFDEFEDGRSIVQQMGSGLAIPACPLALNANRKFDERRQRALVRYYASSQVGGIAVGVHTTQFAIRDPTIGLLEPVLSLVSEELRKLEQELKRRIVRIAGVCGLTRQAVVEATLARELGYDAGLVSLSAFRDFTETECLIHCRTVSEVLPIVGFYLQPPVGGRHLSHGFWREFANIENAIAIKIAPFHRYQTLDVVRAISESGRNDIALYTGNDDNIIGDLITPFRFSTEKQDTTRFIVGGLLGQWAVWTSEAVKLHRECLEVQKRQRSPNLNLWEINAQWTDANGAIFDAANGFSGCIAGIHEILRRQGLLEGIWCLDPNEGLSPKQKQEIDRVCRAYPNLSDDEFVRENLDSWLSG